LCSWKRESEETLFDEGQGGKRDLTSGLGRVLKYLLTTAINNQIANSMQIHGHGPSLPQFRLARPYMCLPSLPRPERWHQPPPIYSRSLTLLMGSDSVAYSSSKRSSFPFILPYCAYILRSGPPGLVSLKMNSSSKRVLITILAQSRFSHLPVLSISFFRQCSPRTGQVTINQPMAL